MTIQFNQDIKTKELSSMYVGAPFDEAKEALEKMEYRIISLAENAKLRVENGSKSFIYHNGNFVREGILYIPKDGSYLTKNSPIITNAKEATEAHKKGKEFYLLNEQVEEAKKDSIKLTVGSQIIYIPTKRFGEDEITNYIFGESAKSYGELLGDIGLQSMPIILDYLKDKPFVKPIWFYRITFEDVFGIDGREFSLKGNNRVRGIKNLENSVK